MLAAQVFESRVWFAPGVGTQGCLQASPLELLWEPHRLAWSDVLGASFPPLASRMCSTRVLPTPATESTLVEAIRDLQVTESKVTSPSSSALAHQQYLTQLPPFFPVTPTVPGGSQDAAHSSSAPHHRCFSASFALDLETLGHPGPRCQASSPPALTLHL